MILDTPIEIVNSILNKENETSNVIGMVIKKDCISV